jgi:hypothetical protein
MGCCQNCQLRFWLEAGTVASMTSTTTDTIVVRRAVAADDLDLGRLAALDSQRALRGDVLVAESDGRLRAALSLGDGRVVADPFAATTGHVALLRARADSLRAPARRAGGWLRRWEKAARRRVLFPVPQA